MRTFKTVKRAQAAGMRPDRRYSLRRAGAVAGGLLAAALCGGPGDAAAQTTPAPVTAAQPAATGPAAESDSGFLSGLGANGQLLGDMGGLRPLLKDHGMTLTLQEISEVLGNVTGGLRTGFVYDGLTTATFQLDTARAFGWAGGTFSASALQIHGRNLSTENLATLETASGIEADRATRLWELWYDQKMFAGDVFDLKVGQQSLDQEFLVSQNALIYVNTADGWPVVPSLDLPGGGPAYPLSSLGVRGRWRVAAPLTFLAGVFNGNPVKANVGGDPQLANASGTSFPLNGGVLVIGELQYTSPAPGAMVMPGESPALPGTYKIGFWYDSERFADQRFDTAGLSLADPASSGMPRQHRGNYSLYAVVDQMVWQDPDEPGHNLSLFTRVMGTPQSDRNLVDVGLNAGFNVHAPLPGRGDDTFGLSMGYAHVSSRVAGLDRDTAFFTSAFTPVRGGETYIEATYQYALTPWLQLQPDFQYVFNPGGGVPNAAGTARIGDEAVIGIRTTITF